MLDIIQQYRSLPQQRDKWLAWLFGALIIITYIPAVSFFIGPYLAMLITITCYFIALLSSRIVFSRISVLLLIVILYIVISAMTASFLFYPDLKDKILWVYGYFVFFQPIFLVVYLQTTRKYSLLSLLTVLALGALVITAVTTFTGLNIFPAAVRVLATGNTGEGNVYLSYNIGGFSFIYTLIIALPLYLYLFRYKLFNRWLLLAVIIFLCILVLKAQYGIAGLLMLITITYFAICKQVTNKNIIIALVVLLASFFIVKPLLVSGLEILSTRVNSNILATKYDELAKLLQGDDANTLELNDRKFAYQLSINQFLASPLIGNIGGFISKSNGGHSTFLDTLATSGLFGGFLLFMVFRIYYLIILSPLRRHPAFGYIIWSFILFLILGFLNPVTSLGMIIFLVVPGVAFLQYREESI